MTRLALRIVAVWIAAQAYLLVLRGSVMIATGRDPRWYETSVVLLVMALLWAVLTPPVIAIAERLRFDEHRLRDVVILAATVPLLSFAASALQALVLPRPNNTTNFVGAVLERGIAPNITIAAFAVVFAYVIAGRYEASRAERLRMELDATLTRARAEELRTRLAPRFLFGALERIASAIDDDARRADRLVVQLAGVLQTVLRFDRASAVTLEEELELVDRYASLEGMALQFTADDDTLGAPVAPLSVLQRVERHAAAGARSLRIAATYTDHLEITVGAEP